MILSLMWWLDSLFFLRKTSLLLEYIPLICAFQFFWLPLYIWSLSSHSFYTTTLLHVWLDLRIISPSYIFSYIFLQQIFPCFFHRLNFQLQTKILDFKFLEFILEKWTWLGMRQYVMGYAWGIHFLILFSVIDAFIFLCLVFLHHSFL